MIVSSERIEKLVLSQSMLKQIDRGDVDLRTRANLHHQVHVLTGTHPLSVHPPNAR